MLQKYFILLENYTLEVKKILYLKITLQLTDPTAGTASAPGWGTDRQKNTQTDKHFVSIYEYNCLAFCV